MKEIIIFFIKLVLCVYVFLTCVYVLVVVMQIKKRYGKIHRKIKREKDKINKKKIYKDLDFLRHEDIEITKKYLGLDKDIE